MKPEEFLDQVIMTQMKEMRDDVKDIKKDVHETKITLSAWEEKFVTKDQVIKVLTWIVCTLIGVAGVYAAFKQIK